MQAKKGLTDSLPSGELTEGQNVVTFEVDTRLIKNGYKLVLLYQAPDVSLPDVKVTISPEGISSKTIGGVAHGEEKSSGI